MANVAIFRINYKSDFILTLQSDAGWMTPFCIKFWTGAPSIAYYVGYDGTTYTNCAPVDGEFTKLRVQFDNHGLPIGEMKFQIGYHFTVADFPTTIEDEVINQAAVIIDQDGTPMQVMLDFTGETAPEIQFSLPAYANEAQRIANEEVRIANEQQRIANEQQRIENEQQHIENEEIRQQNEAQRIANERDRVSEFARLKRESESATGDANEAAALAEAAARLAADKAELADDAARLANQKAELAAAKAALANAKAALAAEQAAYAKQQGDYAKQQGDISADDHTQAVQDHQIAVDDHTQAGNDHTRAESDHTQASNDHTQAGNDHTRAEQDHTRAGEDHTQASNDHTTAGSDHTTATNDHTTAGNDHTQAESDHTRAGEDHTRAEQDHTDVQNAISSAELVYDISKAHAVGGVLATYTSLEDALGTDGENIPLERRQGGMSVQFVMSYDNNSSRYVRYNLTADDFSADPADWEQDASIEKLEGGDIIPKLAQNLESWEGREDLTVNTSWSEPVRTTAGDASIVSSKGGKIVSIVPRSDFYASALKATGFNLLRNAVQIGSTTKYYFLVPKLIFGTFGTADEPNGVLFTNAQGEKMTPTVYFKKLSDGVPTSTSYGSACAYTTSNGYRFYTCSEVGYMVVDGVTLASTCAHIAWSRRYDDYVAVNAAGDAGASVSLAAIFTALHAANQPALYINADVRDFIEFTATTAVWHRLCDKVTVSTWTNTEVPSETGGESTYIHSATISGMKSGGVARIGSMMLSVEGTTVSFTDSNATAEAADVVYELSTQASGTVSVTPTYSVEDWGLEYLDGATGTAEVTTQYCRNYPDSLAALAQFDFRDLSQVVGEALAELYAELQGIKKAMQRNAITFDEYGNPLRMGQRMFALVTGAPTEIPKSIGLFRMDSSTGHVWVSKGLTISTNDWKQIQ